MAISEAVQSAAAYFGVFSSYLNALVIALVILLSGFIVGRLLDRALRKLFSRAELDDRLSRALKLRRNYARSTRRGIVFAVYLVSIYFALRQVSADRLAVEAVLAVFALVVLVSAGLAGVEVVPNVLARTHLARRGIAQGETISVVDGTGELHGKVVRMTLMDVQLRRPNGDMVFYPCAALLRAKVTMKRAASGSRQARA